MVFSGYSDVGVRISSVDDAAVGRQEVARAPLRALPGRRHAQVQIPCELNHFIKTACD